jgi:hypothetical protein
MSTAFFIAVYCRRCFIIDSVVENVVFADVVD